MGSKLVMPPPLMPEVLCSSHHSIILSYARAACSSWSKQPSEVGFPFRLRARQGAEVRPQDTFPCRHSRSALMPALKCHRHLQRLIPSSLASSSAPRVAQQCLNSQQAIR